MANKPRVKKVVTTATMTGHGDFGGPRAQALQDHLMAALVDAQARGVSGDDLKQVVLEARERFV